MFNCNLKLKSFTAQPAGILISSISTFGELNWFDCYRKTSSIWWSNFQNFMMEERICHLRIWFVEFEVTEGFTGDNRNLFRMQEKGSTMIKNATLSNCPTAAMGAR